MREKDPHFPGRLVQHEKSALSYFGLIPIACHIYYLSLIDPTLFFVFRFYFVGDEDLLEIIGNSKNVAKLQKHFKKMFAGVSSILLNEDNTVVLGISSREGEEILYKTPVSITEHPKINEWLTLVEKEMRVTLAKLLAESVTEVTSFNKGTAVDLSQYINWIDCYQVGIQRV